MTSGVAAMAKAKVYRCARCNRPIQRIDGALSPSSVVSDWTGNRYCGMERGLPDQKKCATLGQKRLEALRAADLINMEGSDES